MGKGFLEGSPFHIEKTKGNDTKRRNCFNCKNYDEGECTLHLTRITQNNAKECSKFVSAYSNIEKNNNLEYFENLDSNIKNNYFENGFNKKNNISENERLKRSRTHKRYLKKIQERKNSQTRRKKMRDKLLKFNYKIKKANYEERKKLISEKDEIISEFQKKHKKDYEIMKRKNQIK